MLLYLIAHAHFRVYCAYGCGHIMETVFVEILLDLSTVHMIQIVEYRWQIPSFIFLFGLSHRKYQTYNKNVNKVSQDIICQKTPLCCYVGPQSRAKLKQKETNSKNSNNSTMQRARDLT